MPLFWIFGFDLLNCNHVFEGFFGAPIRRFRAAKNHRGPLGPRPVGSTRLRSSEELLRRYLEMCNRGYAVGGRIG